jgi:2'-5' RNA ligase
MRLFFASFLSAENIDAFQSLISELVAGASGALRSVPPATQHLTLAFLGEIAEQDVSECLNALTVVEDLRAIPFSLDPPRILFARKSPRLLKADISKGSERVAELQESLRAALLNRLPRLDIRPKPPHVTLDLLNSVQLVKSKLTPEGPIYETVAESPLSGG